MSVGPEPARDRRGGDQLALEEIRGLFERDRQVARHGIATERDEIEEEIEGAKEPPAVAVRSCFGDTALPRHCLAAAS